jgi:hypothetical protein
MDRPASRFTARSGAGVQITRQADRHPNNIEFTDDAQEGDLGDAFIHVGDLMAGTVSGLAVRWIAKRCDVTHELAKVIAEAAALGVRR